MYIVLDGTGTHFCLFVLSCPSSPSFDEIIIILSFVSLSLSSTVFGNRKKEKNVM